MSARADDGRGADRRESADRVALLACLAALLLALGLAAIHRVGGLMVETDFYNFYAPQAEALLAGQPYTFRHNPPGYILLLTAVTALTGNAFVAGKLLSAVATGLFGWLGHRLFRALFDARIAATATVLLVIAVAPYSFVASTDLLGALAVVTTFWLVLRRVPIRPHDGLLGGMAAAAAYLLRANAIFLLPTLGLALLLLAKPRRTWDALLPAAAFGVGFLLLALPWFVWNTLRFGGAMASTAHVQIAMHFYAPGGDMFGERMLRWQNRFHSLREVLAYRPSTVLRTYVSDVAFHYPIDLATQVLSFPAFLFAGPGFIALARTREPRTTTYVLSSVAGYALLGLVGFYARYYLFLFPLLFLAVAIWFWSEQAAPRRPAGSRASLVWWSALVIVGAGVALSSARQTVRTLRDEPRYLLPMADSLRRFAEPGDAVMGGKPHLAYLAGLRHLSPMEEDTAAFLADLGASGARFFTYSPLEAKIYPVLRVLRDPAAVSDRLRLLFSDSASGTLVYELREPTPARSPPISSPSSPATPLSSSDDFARSSAIARVSAVMLSDRERSRR